MLRLYFNRRGPLPWSVDRGPGTEEFTFKKVILQGRGRTVYTPLAPGEDPEAVPCAWIELDGGIIWSHVEDPAVAYVASLEPPNNTTRRD